MVGIYSQGLLATNPTPAAPPAGPVGGRRGRVSGFSAASRRRLMRLMATLRWEAMPAAPSFVTLTFHRTPDDWQLCFGRWLACVRRLGAHYLWRLEWQKRGAPHYHLILWASVEQLAELRADWHRIAAGGSVAHRRYGWHVRKLDSQRAALHYVSKYVAKATIEPDGDGRRRWGMTRGLPHAPHLAAAITATEYHQLRRAARRLMRSRNRSRRARRWYGARSLTVYAAPSTLSRLVDWAAPLACWETNGGWGGSVAHELAEALGLPPPRTSPLAPP